MEKEKENITPGAEDTTPENKSTDSKDEKSQMLSMSVADIKKLVSDTVKKATEESAEKIKELSEKLQETQSKLEETTKLAEAKTSDEKVVSAEDEKKKPVTKEQEAFLMERVPIQLMKDNGKYKDDVTVTRNGYNVVIQRGKIVMVPRWAALILEESYRQQMVAAQTSEKFEAMYEDKKGRLE